MKSFEELLKQAKTVRCPKCDGFGSLKHETKAMRFETVVCPLCKGKGSHDAVSVDVLKQWQQELGEQIRDFPKFMMPLECDNTKSQCHKNENIYEQKLMDIIEWYSELKEVLGSEEKP